MEFSKPTLVALALLCAAAGAGGVYLLGGGADASAPAAVAPESVEPPELAETEPSAEISVTPPAPAVDSEPQPRATTATRPAPARPEAPAPVERAEQSPAPARAPEQPASRSPAAIDVGEPPAPAEVEAEPESVTTVAELAIPEEPVVLVGVLPEVEFDELILGANSVIGLRLNASVSSETAAIEDAVEARVSRDVLVGGRVAVPAGSRAFGSVTLVDRGGRLRDPARLRVRFTSLQLPDDTRVDIESEPIYREGDSPSDESTATIGGGAIGGAIIGGILGGARGAVIGGTAGAGAGTAAAMATGRDPAVLSSGALVTIRLLRPVSVIVER